MSWLQHDDRLLHRALELAREAAAFASPNPTVGCVLATPAGEPLGEGAHLYDRRDHAEIAALKQAAERGNSVEGATAYVTLEPCTVHGRTGPCADALVAAKITRCVVATADPNPAVHGNGMARLRAGGIEVELVEPTSSLAQQARRLNDAFAFRMETSGLALFTLKSAVSVDGMIAPPVAKRSEIAPHWLTGEAARADVQLLRHTSDALLTGVGTVLADDPSLTDRTGLPRHRRLLRAVLDADLRTPASSKLVQSAAGDVLIFCRAQASEAREAGLRAAGVAIQRLPEDGNSLNLRTVRGLLSKTCSSVLVEGGSTLNASLLREGLVQKVVLYIAETELGAGSIPFAANGISPYELQRELTSVTRAVFPHGSGEDVRLTGYLHDPWSHVEP